MTVRSSVYPRWRGEHKKRVMRSPPLCGLSPLARGTRAFVSYARPEQRFIPAGAGNTNASGDPVLFASVYPRWRGEHPIWRLLRMLRIGLSPLAWGTPYRLLLPTFGQRFIPAGAGNTAVVVSISITGPVYPRWRGEHAEFTAAATAAGGLSPLARGTRTVCAARPAPARFIPAGAGNTNSLISEEMTGAVYPRWRGEHTHGISTGLNQSGLSPLARGTHCPRCGVFVTTRFIPAGAGNTSQTVSP